jgi:hypothetical protein
MKLHEALKKNTNNFMVPWDVWRLFGEKQKVLEIVGDQVSLGEDVATLEEARNAVAWYVDQLGGKVKWGKE